MKQTPISTLYVDDIKQKVLLKSWDNGVFVYREEAKGRVQKLE
jgi:hypothetical protein